VQDQELQFSEFPQFWIAKNCKYWDAKKNLRFKLYRIDSHNDWHGNQGAVWDAERKEWVKHPYVFVNVKLLRLAKLNELPSTNLAIADRMHQQRRNSTADMKSVSGQQSLFPISPSAFA
jgi:hypothetical protein